MAMQMTSAQKGVHKELSDIVTNISPEETPFQSMIGKGKVEHILFEWTEENLADVAENALAEGANAPDHVDNILVERQNRTQIFGKTVQLSSSSQKNRLAGGTQAMAHQVALRAKELKRDVEYAYVGTAQASSSSGGVRKTAGYQAQLDSAVIKDLAKAAITEDGFNDLLCTLRENGGMPSVVMCHPRLRLALSKALSKDRTRDIANGTAIVNGVTTYASDVGDVKIMTNLWVKYSDTDKVGDVLVFDPSMWSEEVLNDYAVDDLAKTGLSDKKMLSVEKGLKNKNFKASGLFTNVKA